NYGFFVFGYGKRQIENLSLCEIVEKFGELQQDLATHIARFIYLFNETDLFWDVSWNLAEYFGESDDESHDCYQFDDDNHSNDDSDHYKSIARTYYKKTNCPFILNKFDTIEFH